MVLEKVIIRSKGKTAIKGIRKLRREGPGGSELVGYSALDLSSGLNLMVMSLGPHTGYRAY